MVVPSMPPGLENLEIILDIELPLTVRFGRTEMTLQALTQVGPGSVIDLDRSPDEPVEVLINEKVIARGEGRRRLGELRRARDGSRQRGRPDSVPGSLIGTS